MVEQIQAWNRQTRNIEPTVAYWPTGSRPPETTTTTAVLTKTYGLVTISCRRHHPPPTVDRTP